MSTIINADTSDGLKFTSDTSGEIKLQSAGTDTVTVDTSGNVGIGTSSPAEALHISNGNLKLSNSGETKETYISGAGTIELIRDDSVAYIDFKTTTAEDYDCRIQQNSNGLKFYTGGHGSNVLAMTIGSGGEVAIGQGISSNVGLVVSDGNGQHNIPLDLVTTTNTGDVLRVFANEGGSAGSGVYVMPVRVADSLRGGIYWNGSSLAYNTSSDYRLKENIVTLDNGIDKVKLLKPYRFNFIDNPDKTVDGFVAHEVSNVVPESVTGDKDAVDENGDAVYQGLDQAKLVPLLTAALQEAITKIEDLETRIQALENA